MGGLMYSPGQIIWVDLGTSVGREQAGRRPCIVVSSQNHIDNADTLVTVIPCTTRHRGWINHVPVTGLHNFSSATYAMTEQQRTVSRLRVSRHIGYVDEECLSLILRWVNTWIAEAA